MTPSSLVREKALLEVIRQGFLVSSRSQTDAMLGDRTSYVGMSDVGKYLECPRAAVASRIFPEPENLDRLLPLQRGHWFEQGIGEGLSALGLRVLPQLEIDWIYKDTPIRAHLDFTLVWDSPRKAVRILEVRACLETSAFIVTRRHVDKKRLCAAAKTREDCQTVPQRSDGQRMGACTSSPAPCFWRRSEAQNRPA